jgi:lipopolysaccharide transport system ATP-binding protein
MSLPIITIENLGKKYRLNHQAERPRYTTLRDVMADRAKRLVRWRTARESTGIARTEEFWALKDVSLEIKQGEVVGVIGRNGAGKSTLLKILSRITEPTTGRVHVRGRVASLLEVGTGFHPELTGRENIYLNGAILGMARAEIRRKFDEIVAFAEVEKFLDTPVKHYSSGMYVRLAFAVAAHLEPEILVVDEVLAVGDAEFQKKCLGKMENVSKEHGRTVLFVSHNMAAVRTLCSRVLLMSKGTLASDGDSTTVVGSYANTTAASVGSSWCRPASRSTPVVFFRSINAQLRGRQPHLRLDIDVTLVCRQTKAPKLMVAVDLIDPLGGPLMQALPFSEPVITVEKGECLLNIRVALPPLIPGQYVAHLWVGSHYTATLDHVKDAIRIAIDEGPAENRSFPYSPDHGFIVPDSDCKCEVLSLTG